jgi:RNA polymerase sigma factor (TIGR02999 family)
MSNVTRILSAIEQGDRHAAEQLLPLVYDELRKLAAARLAHEAPGNTLDATALVHEAYVRLVRPADADRWNNRAHFFAAAATAMRRILIERARRKQRHSHGGGRAVAAGASGRACNARPGRSRPAAGVPGPPCARCRVRS